MDEDTLDSLLILLSAAGDAAGELEAATRSSGLTASEFRLLALLARIEPAVLSMTTTARELGLTQSGFSRLAARLEHQGILTREADARDSRSALVRLTEGGRLALERAQASATLAATGIFRRLSVGQRKQLERLMGDLTFSSLRR